MKNILVACALILVFGGCASEKRILSTPSKRELRGVWIATVDNIDWPRRGDTNSVSQQQDFVKIINEHQRSNINALFVQVRDACDAFYAKSPEPWSEWLTGKQGKAPVPFYDPMEMMITEAHSRGMEFHAWLNLNRAVFKTAKSVTPDHISNRKPEWILTYDGQKLLNFGIPEVRNYITDVVVNIVKNYDVDGIHFDDYFYPYKVTNQTLQDQETFKKYSRGFKDIEDWRRSNTDLLIKQIADAINAQKSYVKFGISPFGVWKNYSEKDKDGSRTKAGQTSYYDLYADTRKWVEKGWIDYIAPQVYFPNGHKLVSYGPLTDWWVANSFGRHLYIGHGAYRIASNRDSLWKNLSEMPNQLRYNASRPQVSGSLYFSSKSITQNYGGFQDSLRSDFYRYKAIVPPMPWKDNIAPQSPKMLKISRQGEGVVLSWQQSQGEVPSYYVVYRFEEGQKLSLENPANMIGWERGTTFKDTNADPTKAYWYVVTAFDRLHNESKPDAKMKLEIVNQ
jgi:uncharacterized lipoprotein YddW (UPF0748 family)